MFNFFESIANFFSTIINFVVSTIENFIAVVSTIAKCSAAVVLAAKYLPDVLAGIATVIIAYCFVINILNKGG